MKNHFASFLLAVFMAALIGCTSAGKDIHFRSRLPTQETPLFLKDEAAWGVDVDVESQRFTSQMTNNLVTNYHLDEDRVYFSGDSPQIAGVDASLTYRRHWSEILWKAGASFDFLEGQINPSKILGMPENWFVNVNAGTYKTAAFTSSAAQSCWIFCASSSGKLEEDSIRTSQSGQERKVGGQVGHIWHDKHILTISYQWMNYEHNASAAKDGFPELFRQDHFFGSGIGLGYFFYDGRHLIGVTADSIAIEWRGRTERQTVLGMRNSFIF